MVLFSNDFEIICFIAIGLLCGFISGFKFLCAILNRATWYLHIPELITFIYLVFFVYVYISPKYSFLSLFLPV